MKKEISAKPPNKAMPAYIIFGESSFLSFGNNGFFLIKRQTIVGIKNMRPTAIPIPNTNRKKDNS
ncbi:MAG: hypothetical protein ACYSTS_08980 [Planctomycetota bacterium]